MAPCLTLFFCSGFEAQLLFFICLSFLVAGFGVGCGRRWAFPCCFLALVGGFSFFVGLGFWMEGSFQP
jgi:hypothetical protein